MERLSKKSDHWISLGLSQRMKIFMDPSLWSKETSIHHRRKVGINRICIALTWSVSKENLLRVKAKYLNSFIRDRLLIREWIMWISGHRIISNSIIILWGTYKWILFKSKSELFKSNRQQVQLLVNIEADNHEIMLFNKRTKLPISKDLRLLRFKRDLINSDQNALLF